MEAVEPPITEAVLAVDVLAVDGSVNQSLPTKRFQKKRRRFLSGESKYGKGGGKRPPHKKMKAQVSSTRAANNIMKFRLKGSVSDPLNLEGGDDVREDCSTCAPSPATPLPEEMDPPTLPNPPPQLKKDPLNLEGKVKNFPLSVVGLGSLGSCKGSNLTAGQRRKPRRRTTSSSKPDNPIADHVKVLPRDRRFHYGNYNRYYGYRYHGTAGVDLRLALLRKEWFQGKDCLDIGCNTGQVTIAVARDMNPRSIVGLDIDHQLIMIAWKNLHRNYALSFMPDGKPFPRSLILTRGLVNFPLPCTTTMNAELGSSSCCGAVAHLNRGGGGGGGGGEGGSFPSNVDFKHGNYVPSNEMAARSQGAQYDVILALSLTKWVHLNWGDAGIKSFFQKVYAQLRPGGKFILEPQPFNSYSKKKKLTAVILKNYQSICFYPRDFHDYLMSAQVGFTAHQFLGIPSNKSIGFQRPLHLYVKALSETSSVVSSLSSSSSLPLGQDKEQLKSAVVVLGPTTFIPNQSTLSSSSPPHTKLH